MEDVSPGLLGTVLIDCNIPIKIYHRIQLIPPREKSQGSICWLKLSLLPLDIGQSTVLEGF